MKDHKKVLDEVFAKADEYEKAKKTRRKKYLSVACCFVIVAVIAFGGYTLMNKNGNNFAESSESVSAAVSGKTEDEQPEPSEESHAEPVSAEQTSEEEDKKAPEIICGSNEPDAEKPEELKITDGTVMLSGELRRALDENDSETALFAVTVRVWSESDLDADTENERKDAFFACCERKQVTVTIYDSTYKFQMHRDENWDGSYKENWDIGFMTEEQIRSLTSPDDCMYLVELVPEYAAFDCGSRDVIEDAVTDEDGRFLVHVNCYPTEEQINNAFKDKYGTVYRKAGERVEDAIMRCLGREGENYYALSEDDQLSYLEQYIEMEYDLLAELVPAARDAVIYEYGLKPRFAYGENDSVRNGNVWLYLSYGEIEEVFADERVREVSFEFGRVYY